MRKTMSFREFKLYCGKHKPGEVMFCSANQEEKHQNAYCKQNFSFQVMLLYENPNTICLKSAGNIMSLRGIKLVTIDTDRSNLGTVLTLSCGGFYDDDISDTYTLIAI